ncbi:LPXTG cell wall anchor domain-containing protein [Catenuloplanes japonicus]|uniref:LPXTG cell wall anchor domain-containing protein n=1 Tax=Catenuloplanes japonicus TaxID=33876 RepID=UPI00052713BA|nr:LPXTG cell wall anchor domain-containing protein [Catenuloplanes japonicus]
MNHLVTRRLFAGLGAAVTAGAVALSGTPASAAVTGVAAFLYDVTVAVDSPGVSRSVSLYAEQEIETTDLTLTFDTVGLAGIATLTPEVDPWFDDFACTTAGTVTTCVYAREWPTSFGPDGVSGLLNYTIAPVTGAVVDASGTLAYTMTSNGMSSSGTSRVTIGEGVDLAAYDAAPVTVPGTPGGTAVTRAGVSNVGAKDADGVVLWVGTERGMRLSRAYSNCWYRTDNDQGAYCEFDETLTAGGLYSTGLTYDVDASVPSPGRRISFLQWLTPSEFTDTQSQWAFGGTTFAKGTGSEKLTLTSSASARRAQTDTDETNNYSYIQVEMTGANPADLAAIGTTVDGDAGATEEIRVGMRNLGPATIDTSWGGVPAAFLRVRVPEGTTAVTVDENCFEFGEAAGGYVCAHPETRFPAGTDAFFTFTLRIDKKITNATGQINVNDKDFCAACAGDGNTSNDVSYIVANGDGTVPVPGTGGEGGGGGTLPVTGVQTGLIGAAGVALLALGAGAFLLARRRRTSFVA